MHVMSGANILVVGVVTESFNLWWFNVQLSAQPICAACDVPSEGHGHALPLPICNGNGVPLYGMARAKCTPAKSTSVEHLRDLHYPNHCSCTVLAIEQCWVCTPKTVIFHDSTISNSSQRTWNKTCVLICPVICTWSDFAYPVALISSSSMHLIGCSYEWYFHNGLFFVDCWIRNNSQTRRCNPIFLAFKESASDESIFRLTLVWSSWWRQCHTDGMICVGLPIQWSLFLVQDFLAVYIQL